MHSPELALQTLEHLWRNYLTLGEQVDLGLMSWDRSDAALAQPPAVRRSLEFASWLAAQGFFFSAWALWEYHSRAACDGLPNKASDKGKSHVQWAKDTFDVNGRTFAEYAWFVGGNALRNLIAHHAARVAGPDAERWWKKAQPVFPQLQLDPDGYVLIDGGLASQVMWKVGEFIRDPSRRAD
jgi:hypothetical protein